MGILKIALGFAALFLAWGLLFRTGLIFRLNAWVRDNLLNDQVVLYSRRRLALLLLILGVVALFSGVENVVLNMGFSTEARAALIEKVQKDFKSHEYTQVVAACRLLLKSDPKNVPVREYLVNALWAIGQKDIALKEAQILSQLSPANATARTILGKAKSVPNSSKK